MAIREIRVDGDDILRKKSKPVKDMTKRIKQLIEDMYETMYAADGVGLAAVQVGVLKRIFVIDIGEGPITFINPEIVLEEGEQTGEEGCLSLPHLQATVTRPDHVIIKALDENMNERNIEGTELLARAMVHEYDHLDGILYKDKAESELYDVRVKQAEQEEQ